MSLFESINYLDSLDRTASRKALVLANRRAQNQFGNFLSVKGEFQARFAAINDDLKNIVIEACQETGYDDPRSIYQTVASFLEERSELPFIVPEASFPDRTEIPDYNGPNINQALKAAPSAVGVGESVIAAKDKKKEHTEGAVCSSCSDGSCSGCSGGNCGCGCGGTTASVKVACGPCDKGECMDCSGGDCKCTKCKTSSVHEADEKWIQKAVPKKNRGLLHKKLDVPSSEKIPEDKLEGALHSDNDKLREEAQFAENMKGLHKGAIPGAHDPNYNSDTDSRGIGNEYGGEGFGDIDSMVAELQAMNPGVPYEQLVAMAEQELDQQEAYNHPSYWSNPGIGPNVNNEQYPTEGYFNSQGGPAYASIHEAAKHYAETGDTIEERMKFPAQNGEDTATGLSTDSPVNIDRKTWAPKNMPDLDVDKSDGMHNQEIQDATTPTEFKGDAFDKDDGRFDSFHDPHKFQNLPSAKGDSSGFAPNNMTNPQSTGDTWNGTAGQTSPVTKTPSSVLGAFLSAEEVQKVVQQFKG